MFDCWITILNACKKNNKNHAAAPRVLDVIGQEVLSLAALWCCDFCAAKWGPGVIHFFAMAKGLGECQNYGWWYMTYFDEKGGSNVVNSQVLLVNFSSIFVVSGPFLLSEDSDSSGDRPTLPASGCGHHLLVMPGQSQMPCKKSLYIIYNIVYNIVFHNIVL